MLARHSRSRAVEQRIVVARAAVVAVVAALVLLLAYAALLGDVLQARNASLFYRVNAFVLESEASGALTDSVSVAAMLLFNIIVFGIPAYIGARLCPPAWWAPSFWLLALGLVAWCNKFGALYFNLPWGGAAVTGTVDLALILSCVVVGGLSGKQRRNELREQPGTSLTKRPGT